MKRVLLLFICLFIVFTTQAQGKPSTHRKVFVKQFMKNVCENNSRKVRKSLNNDYLKNELKILDGDKKQFLNELFLGIDKISGESVSIKFNDISSISIYEIAEITAKDKKIAWVYVFEVSDGEHTILAPLLLEKHFGSFGFIAARR